MQKYSKIIIQDRHAQILRIPSRQVFQKKAKNKLKVMFYEAC